jgi:hypothetical protein
LHDTCLGSKHDKPVFVEDFPDTNPWARIPGLPWIRWAGGFSWGNPE